MFHVSFPGLGINDLPINRVAFSIGSFNVYWYGILIATGLLLAVTYAYVNAHRYDVDRNKLIDCVIVGIITSIIGARAYGIISRRIRARSLISATAVSRSTARSSARWSAV